MQLRVGNRGMFVCMTFHQLTSHQFSIVTTSFAPRPARTCHSAYPHILYLSWRRYVKFDTFHPAVDIGLPVTRVISRVVLQRKLAEKAEELEGKGVLANDCHVVDYEEVGPL